MCLWFGIASYKILPGPLITSKAAHNISPSEPIWACKEGILYYSASALECREMRGYSFLQWYFNWRNTSVVGNHFIFPWLPNNKAIFSWPAKQSYIKRKGCCIIINWVSSCLYFLLCDSDRWTSQGTALWIWWKIGRCAVVRWGTRLKQERRCEGDGVKWHIIAKFQLLQNFRAVNVWGIVFPPL